MATDDDSLLWDQDSIQSRELFSSTSVQLCFENLNGSCVRNPYSPGPRLILYAVFGFGAVLAVCGNLLVVMSILHFRQLHSPANFLVASLACADFLVGLTVMPFSTVRYVAVSDPLTYPTRFTTSFSGKCITFSWLLSIIYSFSLLYTGANEAGLEDVVSALTCVGSCQGAVNQNWVFVNFLLFFIPALVMITVYSKIFLIAKEQAQKIESMSEQTANTSDSYKDRVAKRERKAAKTLGIAVAAFLLSWLPYFIDSFIDAFLGFITPPYVYEILVWIAYYNSAMNPLIYAFFYPWFRKAIKLIVTGRILRENSSATNLFPE